MTLKSDAQFKRKQVSCFKNDKNLVKALKCLQKFYFGPFRVK